MTKMMSRQLLIPLLLMLSSSPLQAEDSLHALYLMQQGQAEESIRSYRHFTEQSGRHHFDLLQRMGLLLLHKGIESTDPQVLTMTLFGAGLSGSSSALEILERGMHHSDPQIQMLALHFLAKIEDDEASDLLYRAMSSDFLAIRLESAFHLCQRKHPLVAGQLEGLLMRLPAPYKPLFPSLFALLGTNEAGIALQKFLEDPDPNVRIEAILNLAKMGRDDFLPTLRRKLTHMQVDELEATIFAAGVLQDRFSLPRLKKLAKSSSESVRIAAGMALAQFKDRSSLEDLAEMAHHNNLFAIQALGNLSETESLLAPLLESEDLQVRLNASVALLQRRDPRCAKGLLEIFLADGRDLAFQPFVSAGRTLNALKAIPSSELQEKDPSVNLSYSLTIRESLLQEALHLPEETFLSLAKQLFDAQQNDLVPTLISLLETLQTEGAIQLLKEGTKRITAPLIRDYCYLALYRLNQEGPYEAYVNHWVMRQKACELIRLRPLLPLPFRMQRSDYSLTPEETSRLLVDSFLSIASRREERSIDFFLEAMELGNANNRYALMGLLMKATH